ncbi:MAG TPA: helix-turn-helix domain-containing protein [Microlunatus sp.]|nr:helix-turn-helix domain-containing protein [Microlunatus sp.]
MYVLRRPAPSLRRFIEHYWFVAEAGEAPVDLRIEVFVDLRADLIFNFGAPYRRSVIGGSTLVLAHSNLDAQRLVPIRIEQRGRVRAAGARFHLGGVAPFTDVHLADWSGTTSAPAGIFGPAARRLEAALRKERDLDAAAVLLDAFFVERLGSNGPDPRFRGALDLLQDSAGTLPLGDIADAARMSTRHLQRLFARHLGFPPKTVARVLRFQHALTGLMDDPQAVLGDLAAASGYFDQAHFIKDFSRFSGGVPRGYRGYYPPAAPTDFAPNVVVFLQDLTGASDPDWRHDH